jgi:hypothetical protein
LASPLEPFLPSLSFIWLSQDIPPVRATMVSCRLFLKLSIECHNYLLTISYYMSIISK